MDFKNISDNFLWYKIITLFSIPLARLDALLLWRVLLLVRDQAEITRDDGWRPEILLLCSVDLIPVSVILRPLTSKSDLRSYFSNVLCIILWPTTGSTFIIIYYFTSVVNWFPRYKLIYLLLPPKMNYSEFFFLSF